MIRRLVAVAALILAGCSPPPTESLQMVALGTLVEVSAYDPRPSWDEAVRHSFEPWAATWGRDMYAYGDGELARANAAWARGQCVPLSADLAWMVATAGELEQRHGDRFVAAMGELTRLWQLHTTRTPNWRPPSDTSIAAALTPPPRTAQLYAQDAQTCARQPVQLDTGGFGKGVALDRLAATLRELEVDGALINIGGDVAALGQRGRRPWLAGIQDPSSQQALAVLEVRDGESVMTSGDYARFQEHENTHYGHILDPVSGRPIRGIASVTVIGTDATRTDAAATALFVAAGRARTAGQWPRLPPVADAHRFVVIGGDGSAVLSASMAARLTWIQQPDQLHLMP